MIATGCQSTGNVTQPIAQTDPAPAEPEITATKIEPVAATPELKTVYFEYNRWELRDEARSALATHPELYAEDARGICLRIEGGELDLSSLQCAGYGYASEIDWKARTPLADWTPNPKTLEVR